MSNEATFAEQIETLELSIEECKLKIERFEALGRLEKNKDFKKLFTEGFLQDHAVRQVMLKAHPTIMGNEMAMAQVDSQIAGCGALKQFLVAIHTEGLNAQQAIQEDENTLAEVQAEALEQENVQ
jgi:hypothetical protein